MAAAIRGAFAGRAILVGTVCRAAGRIQRTMNPKIYPVILCGGSGSRLWPMSRQLLPKQFLPLLSERTMLQETVSRLAGLAGVQAPVIVSNSEHRFLVAEQLRAIGVTPRSIRSPARSAVSTRRSPRGCAAIWPSA